MLDIDIFRKSLQKLKQLVSTDYVEDGNTYIVAISRKGPRLLESLFGDALSKYQVVTEYSLPFIFKKMAEKPTTFYRMMIVDDAVYYGSTLDSLFNQITSYKNEYRLLHLDVKAYVAIKANESKTIENLEIKSFDDEKIGAGYCHFFVRNVMARIREMHTSMEVDFPRLTYKMNSQVNQDILYDSLNATDEYQNKVYRVSHSGGGSINILLPQVNGAYFNKIRIFTDGDEVRLVAMTPRMITDSVERLETLFVNADASVSEFWRDLLENHIEPWAFYDENLLRSVKKVLVALANYLYSINTILEQRNLLEKILVDNFGGIHSVDRKFQDIKYLIGDDCLSNKMLDLLKKLYESEKNHFIEYRINITKLTDVLAFESYDILSKETKDVLDMHNRLMIEKSESIPQALSAIFFNQTLLVERLTRNNGTNVHDRLRFGYTFHSLTYLISGCNPERKIEDNILELHSWIDKRVDYGCVVPQYIVDSTNNTWTRVFRPGENEDIILSYIARWVIFVLKRLKPGLVRREYLSGILACLALDGSKKLQNELGIELKPEKDDNYFNLFFSDESGIKTDVLEYMMRMFILVEKDGAVEISRYLEDRDVLENTTLSKELLDMQKDKISQIMKDFDEFFVPSLMPYLIFNYYFRNQINMEGFRRSIRENGEIMIDVLSSLEIRINQKCEDISYSDETDLNLKKSFSSILQYIISIGYILNNKLDNDEVSALEIKAYQLNIVKVLLQNFYYRKRLEYVSEMIKRQEVFYKEMNAESIWSLLMEMIEQKNYARAYRDRSLVFALRSYINNVIFA